MAIRRNSAFHPRVVSDSDPIETQEWFESLQGVLATAGTQRCEELLFRLREYARFLGIKDDTFVTTPYCNTIPVVDQPAYPGDLDIERRITAIVRWNALAMVVRANRHSTELGGHLSSYASAADLYEVGFNHFFRGSVPNKDSPSTADLVFFQPHSAPGIYARAFLEGRLTEEHLLNYRREVEGKGLCSYPHPC
jgi:pyruvate dehydrogenase E1 component